MCDLNAVPTVRCQHDDDFQGSGPGNITREEARLHGRDRLVPTEFDFESSASIHAWECPHSSSVA